MIYSGADLIRTASQQQERMERLQVAHEVKPLEKPAEPKSSLDEETKGALLRFARFFSEKKEKRKGSPRPPSKSSMNPYIEAEARRERLFDSGQQLDIYV